MGSLIKILLLLHCGLQQTVLPTSKALAYWTTLFTAPNTQCRGYLNGKCFVYISGDG